MSVWVKICGITNPDDARAAWDAGADAIGLNFVSGPRKLTIEAARPALAQRVPAGTVVALVELDRDGIDPALADLLRIEGVEHLQLYGRVSLDAVAALQREGWRPIVVCRPEPGDLAETLAPWLEPATASRLFALLVDAHDPERAGGTGRTVDWKTAAKALRTPKGSDPSAPPAAASKGSDPKPRIILAGGLNPQNVRAAIETLRPWGVDVASGVESAPGRKDHRAVAEFVRAAKAAR